MEAEEVHLPKHCLIPMCQNQLRTIATVALTRVTTKGLDTEN